MTTKQSIGRVRSPIRIAQRQGIAARVVVVLLMLSGEGWAASAENTPNTPPADARTMTGVELFMLYRNKSWKWEHGAGRMEEEGRAFKAWSDPGSGSVWATGRWIVTDRGRLCIEAHWHTPTGTYPDKVCFQHRISDRTIYQKKEPSGDWYVFRHPVPKDSDEFAKLVSEDLVSSKPEFVKSPPKAILQNWPYPRQTFNDVEKQKENQDE